MSSIMKRIEEYVPGILAAGERMYDQKSFLNSMVVMLAEDPEKLKCFDTNVGKASILNALKRAASTGLSLNPQSGKAAIIVYYSQAKKAHIAQYQVMKNGMIDLAMSTGKVKFITCDTVRKNDKFSIRKTISGDTFDFEPDLDDRGPIRGFFAAMVMNDGQSYASYMTVKEMEAHRDNYSAARVRYNDGKEKEDAAWNKSFEGMGLKTVMKKLLRNSYIDQSSDVEESLRGAIHIDDISESESFDDAHGEHVADHKGSSAADVTENIKSAKSKVIDIKPAPEPEKEDPTEESTEEPKQKAQPKALPSDSPFK